MKVYLRMPERHETAINLNLVPKTGENIEYAGNRYLVVSVIHAVESSKTILEVVRVASESPYRTLSFSESSRYRTSELRSFSQPLRMRINA